MDLLSVIHLQSHLWRGFCTASAFLLYLYTLSKHGIILMVSSQVHF